MIDLGRYWYRPSLHGVMFFLLAFSWVFSCCAAIRRWMYRAEIKKIHRFSVPVIVVGNITVGGTGKTPCVISLATFLKSQGYRPGIVSRGVGGKKHSRPRWVKPDSSANEVGDEAILLSRHTSCPVVVGVNRVAAVCDLLKQSSCDLVISDDGLQHYRLGRDIEIAVVDGVRRFGNRYLLPAGPLREPVARLNTVDFVIVNGGNHEDEFTMTLEPLHFVSLWNSEQTIPFSQFPYKKIHAVAGIGHPERFFHMLQNAGVSVIAHPFPDHHHYQAHEFNFNDALPIVMTEKDAVKCGSFADDRYWYLSVHVKMDHQLEKKILTKLKSMETCHEYENDFAMRSCSDSHRIQHDNICKRE